VIHRHLDYSPDVPLVERGDDALDDLLTRGDLFDWQPLLRAIAASPHAELADRVLRLLEANPRYGTSPLWRLWIARLRTGTETPPVPRMSLASLREQSGRSQSAVGAAMGISQSDVSKLERRHDWRVSSLRRFVRALGWRLRLTVVDDSGRAIAHVDPDPDRDAL
jgi:hypothetical protein